MYNLTKRAYKSAESWSLGDKTRNDEALDSTRNRISSLKFFCFLLLINSHKFL